MYHSSGKNATAGEQKQSNIIHNQGVSRFGLVVRQPAGKQKDYGSILLQLSSLFKSCGLWTLSCDFALHSH